MMLTIKQLETALPEFLEQFADDLVAETNAGRLMAVMPRDSTEALPDGSFTFEVRSYSTSDLANVPGGAQLATSANKVRERGCYPVALFGSDGTLVVGLTDYGNGPTPMLS